MIREDIPGFSSLIPGFFARYARQAAAVPARADIRRITDSEQQCCELAAVSRRTGGHKEHDTDVEIQCAVAGKYQDTEHVSPSQTSDPEELVTEVCFPVRKMNA